MISSSKEFKEKLKKGANIVNYADITLSNGEVLHLTYKDFMIGGCSIEDKTTDGKFGVGFVIGKTLSIRIANHDERFSNYDFYNSIIRVYVAMAMDNGKIEKIRKGVYYATVPSTQGEIIEINAVDGMFLLDKDYSTSKTAYPATLQTILTNACLDCGIPIGFRQFDNMNYVVKEKPETGTYRQIVSYACQIAGYNARIDNDGYMQLIWYNSALLEQYNYVGGDFKQYPHGVILDGGTFTDYSTNKIISGGTFTDAMPEHIFQVKSLDVHTDDVQITGVRVIGEDDKAVLFGEEGYLIEVKNPFVNGKEQVVANYLGGRMVGMVFRPFTAQILSNPLYEPFEVVRVSDWKGNVYISIVNSVSYKVGGYTQVACVAEDPIRNGSMYYSEAAAAVVEARRNTQKQLSTYDKAVQQMNELAANAMGLYRKEELQENGSYISYESDKPITVDENGKCHFVEGSHVWKKSDAGFFVSEDGGKTYTAGFDKNGNAVINILYAIGINADWINTGYLSADRIRGGYLVVGGKNNERGIIEILGQDGKVYGYIDNLGYKTENNNYYYAIRNGILTLQYKDDSKTRRFESFCSPTGNYTNLEYLKKISDSAMASSRIMFRIGDVGDCSIMVSANISNQGNISIYAGGSNGTGIDVGSFTRIKDSSVKVYNTELSTIGISCGKASILSSNGNASFESLQVSGYKSRISKTKNYSDRLLYCYETPKPYFGDIGEATLDEDGICYIFVDDIFLETINTKCQYQVFLQKYGQGDVWVEERNPNYFLIKGTPHLKFGWELKARQLGYETERLEKFVQEEPEETIDYEKEAQNYIDEYYREVLSI